MSTSSIHVWWLMIWWLMILCYRKKSQLIRILVCMSFGHRTIVIALTSCDWTREFCLCSQHETMKWNNSLRKSWSSRIPNDQRPYFRDSQFISECGEVCGQIMVNLYHSHFHHNLYHRAWLQEPTEKYTLIWVWVCICFLFVFVVSMHCLDRACDLVWFNGLSVHLSGL